MLIKIIFFHFYFLNQDFFLTIISINLLFGDLVDNVYLEGTMSQNFPSKWPSTSHVYKFSVVWSKDAWNNPIQKSLLKITIFNFPCGVYFYFITHSHIL